MTLKFNFFYKHSNKDYFLGLLQKVALSHSVEIRAEVCDELLCVFVSGSNESLGAFADALEVEIPLSLYFRFKSAEMCEKPLGEKIEQNLSGIFSVSEINAIKNPSDSRFCDIFSDSTQSVESSKNQSHKVQIESRPIRGAKNRIQGCSSATADFLLESEKRGSPPKSEKAAAFWRVGGAGRGVQPFLREKSSESKKSNNDYFANNYEKLDSPDSLKTALYNLCDDLAKGQSITLTTSKGAISLSIKSDDFDFILANDISTISLYTRASADELNALASFEKPLIDLAIKEVFAREVGAKNALFILPYDIILCCISSILLKREIAFVYGKKIDLANLNLVYDSTHKSDFFEIVVGQNGYFLKKNFLDLSANPNAKNLSNLWDFLDFSFDDFKGESKNSDIFIAYLSTKNPTHLANLRNKMQILTITFDKNPKNILQKITTLENGDKLIANFKKAFEARYEAIQSLDSTPQWTQNIVDIFECAAMILGRKRDKNAIFDLAKSYIRDIGPKIDFKNVRNSSLGAPFALGENFGEQQTSSLVLSPKFSPNTKLPPQILELDSKADSAESKNGEFTNPPQKTIEGIAVEVAEFLPNFECETRLEVCEHSKFGKSMQDAPKSELQTSDLIYDESRTIRSVISFTLAGSEPEVIAFGIIESLVDYLVLIFRDAQEKFGTKNMGIIGDIFANKIFFDKITQKIPKDFNLVFPKFLDYD